MKKQNEDLKKAIEIIYELLGTFELNMDSMEEMTMDTVNKAKEFLDNMEEERKEN